MKRVAVVGAYGRMGSAISAAVQSDESLELVSRIGSADSLESLLGRSIDLVIDVTNHEAAAANLLWLADNNINAVVGTTGFSDAEVKQFDTAFRVANLRCFLVPNFSIGAVLLMRFAGMAARYFDAVEIVELHHEKKKDAPSGTARLTAEQISKHRTEPWAPDATEHVSLEGARGAEQNGIHIHSVRLPGLLAHEEVIFGATGQTLTLRHDSFDRSSFMPGALLAAKSLDSLAPGVTTGLESVLNDAD